MFEHKSHPIISRQAFLLRMARTVLVTFGIIAISLLIGVMGYRITESMSWIDSLLNASMILSGMGPANTLNTDAGKLFASMYALFSGIVFISSAGILVAPVFHRVMHQMHVDVDES